ncbi:MAG TPA: MFS transporter [Acidimicrobiales bacterium]|jgi:NNP family nitrate/nitrite transporter-like MFS transporter|nr:MFS transporter [Acidimicrobiales bacterium]
MRTDDRPGRWIEDWDPENETFWQETGRKVARTNLAISMFTEHLGFSLWVVWTVVVLNLGHAGIDLSVSQLFVLTLLPNLVGSLLRIPYAFAVPRLGGRACTTISSLMLLVPAGLLAWVVPSHWLAHESHHVQMWILGLCAASSGVGGGNFASSMANISYFYPERCKGWALGLNAAGGNLGVATAQLLVPLVVIIGIPATTIKLAKHHVHLAYAGYMWLPLIVVGAVLAWTRMNSLTQARADKEPYLAALRHRPTWVLSFLYVGTFGSFIGFSFAMPLVIKNSFPAFLDGHPFIANYLAGLGFLGALVGSSSRPIGGWLADRVGGARVTLASFCGMAAATGVAIGAVERHAFVLFLIAFQFLFVLSGIGNGSTYKMIASAYGPSVDDKRQAAATIGIAGAVGALGGVVVQVVIRQSSLQVSALETAAKTSAAKAAIAASHAAWSVPALVSFLASYAVFAGVVWAVYIRRPAVSHALATP